jgi:hypothetical protein
MYSPLLFQAIEFASILVEDTLTQTGGQSVGNGLIRRVKIPMGIISGIDEHTVGFQHIDQAKPVLSAEILSGLSRELHSFKYGIKSSHDVNASWTSISITGPLYLDAAIADAGDVVGVMVMLSFLSIGETQ